MKRAKELGQTVYSTCEHGFQGNIYEAQTLCEKYGLKPIYAVEAYYVDDRHDHSSRANYHLMLIAMTKKARYEINKIMSIANQDGFFYKPRIDKELVLSLTPTDTVVTSACIMSPMFKGDSWLENFFLPMKEHFGKNFYLEVQDHVHPSQIEFNKKILQVHNQYNVSLIHGCDSHYIYPEDAQYRNLFLKAKGISYPEEDGFVLDYPDSDIILNRYQQQGVLTQEEAIEALNNTLIFEEAEPIYTDKEFKIPLVPDKFIQEELGPNYSNKNNNKVLRALIKNAWRKKEPTIKPEKRKAYTDAIYYEEGMVEECGMASYFVLNHIVVNRAKEKYGGVLTRTGRGSAVSFLINNLLGLTEVDRIKAPTKLYPTRFLSPDRVNLAKSIPDIDQNWADVKHVVKATKDVLGEDQIYYMIVYKPMQRSSAFRLWCKANDFAINDYDDCAKMLSDKHISDEDVEAAYPKWSKQIEDSKRFRGVIESMSPSPCSFLLSNDPISELTGLIRIKDEMCSCLDGYNCDVYKFLKNDYLTATTVDITARVYQLIGRPIDDIATLVHNCDDEVWDIYAKGLTTTINQADSDMAKGLLKRYKPRSLRELAMFVAAIRPGFKSLLETFISRTPYTTGVKELDDQLEDSAHMLCYQESIMTYLVWLGIPEKDTYDIIKKISKKKFKPEELQQLHDKLLASWKVKVGTDDESMQKFENTWHVVNDAAKYSFNASHALSVGTDSLYGAYLKAHYPLEYFSVVLTLYSEDIDRTAKLKAELPYFHIKLKEPKFGKAKADYTMDKENHCIYKGVQSIRFMNKEVAGELYALSQENHYDNFVDLLKDINDKTSVNSNQLDILIKLNFFSAFGKNATLLKTVEIFNSLYGKKVFKKNALNGISEDLIRKYAEKETEKQYRMTDTMPIIRQLVSELEDKSIPVQDQLLAEQEYLGYITTTYEEMPDTYWFVTDYKCYSGSPTKPYLMLYNLHDGSSKKTKIKNGSLYVESPFGLHSIINVNEFTPMNKFKKVDGKFVKTDEKEDVITNYTTILNTKA